MPNTNILVHAVYTVRFLFTFTDVNLCKIFINLLKNSYRANDYHQWLSDSFRVHQTHVQPQLCPVPADRT